MAKPEIERLLKDIEKDIKFLKSKMEDANKVRSQLEGKRDLLMEKLYKDFEITHLPDAYKELERLEKEIDSLSKEFTSNRKKVLEKVKNIDARVDSVG